MNRNLQGSGQKRRRSKAKNPILPSERLQGGRDQHQILLNQDGQQRSCVYCCHLRALAKLEGSDLPHVRKPKKMCLQCNVHLCTEHFSLYHGYCGSLILVC